MNRLSPRALPFLLLAGLLIVASACRSAASSSGSTARPPLTTQSSTDDSSAAVSPDNPLRPLTAPPTSDPTGVRAQVTYVYDGDTIEVELDGRVHRLRYIGVDSPERGEPFYREALDFNRNLVEGRAVLLVQDVSEVDQYGRLLRYVYLEDGTFVNGEMMINGLARLVTFPPDVAQTDYLRELQQEAQNAATGMWSRPDLVGPCDCDRNLYNCRDFQSQAEAQTCHDYCMEIVGRDVHKLDGGGDGLVCEFLP